MDIYCYVNQFPPPGNETIPWEKEVNFENNNYNELAGKLNYNQLYQERVRER